MTVAKDKSPSHFVTVTTRTYFSEQHSLDFVFDVFSAGCIVDSRLADVQV